MCQGCSKYPKSMFYKQGKECYECEGNTQVIVRNIVGGVGILIFYIIVSKYLNIII